MGLFKRKPKQVIGEGVPAEVAQRLTAEYNRLKDALNWKNKWSDPCSENLGSRQYYGAGYSDGAIYKAGKWRKSEGSYRMKVGDGYISASEKSRTDVDYLLLSGNNSVELIKWLG